MSLKKDVRTCLLWILILCPTLGVSQKVQIDSIKQTTLLDKKATIAQGNISKQRDSLIVLAQDQERLIDSLRKESAIYKQEADSLRKAYANLKFVVSEKQFQIDGRDKAMEYSKQLYDAELKALRQRRFGIGVSIGYGIGKDGTTIFSGIGLNYTFIRL